MGSIKTISIIVAANIKGLEAGLGKANKSLAKFASGAARMGSMMSFGITAPLVALGKSAFDTFAKFENGMMKVKTVTGASIGEFKMLTEEAKRLGRTTQFTALQVADLQLVLGRKGFDPTAIKNMEESILDLALATGEDLSLAANTVATSINAFGLESNEAARVANTLASAAANSSIQLSTFSTAFGHAGASASAVGVDLEELSAMMGVLMDNGIKASKSGTGLRKVFMKLHQEGRNFTEVLDLVTQGEVGLQKAQKLVGVTAANQLLILAKNKDKIAELTQEYRTNTGRLKEMAALMGGTTHAKVLKMQSAIESMKIEIGALISDAILPLIKKITGWATAFGSLNKSTKKTILVFAGILAAIGPVLLLLAAGSSIIGIMGVGFTILKGAVVAFGGALKVALLPMIKIIAIGAAIGAIVMYIIGNWDAFKERLTDVSWWKNMFIEMAILAIKYNPINGLIILINKGLEALGQKQFKNPFDNLTDALEGKKDPEKKYEHQFTGVVDGIMKGLAKTKIALQPALDAFKNMFDFSGSSIEPELKIEVDELDFEDPEEDEEDVFIEKKIGFTFPSMQEIKDKVSDISGVIGEFADAWGTQISAAFDVIGKALDNQMIIVENSHKKEAELIEASSMTESAKAEAMVALEEKTAEAKAKIQRKQAIAQKAAALVAAVINGAQAITKVAGQTGIGAIAAAPMMAALVGAQIALIASSPIPAFADGGIVSGPTLGLIGEYSGARSNPEIIAPLDKLQGMLGNSNENANIIPDVRISGSDLLIVFNKARKQEGGVNA